MSTKQESNDQWVATSLKIVGEFFGVDESTIKTWRAKGMPGVPGKGKRSGCYRLDEITQWLHTQGPWRPRQPSDVMEVDGASPELERYRKARADLAELDVAERCGELCVVSAIHHVHVSCSARYRKLGQELQKRWGQAAHDLVERCIDDVEREAQRYFDSLPSGYKMETKK